MHKLLISITILIALLSMQVSARHNSGEIMFTSILKGDAEVPAVTTNARGVATFNLNGTMDTLFVNGTFAGLSGAIVGAHIHNAPKGVSGDVVINLTNSINNNQIMGFVTGAALSSANMKAMLDGNTYLNIHTMANPGGEIRGQLTTETDYSFFTTLSGTAEVPAVTTSGEGFATIIVSKTNKRVWINAVYNGTSGAITGAHLHNAMAGVSGDVIVNLTDMIDGNKIMGSIEIDESLDLWTKLANGEVYINLHTTANPGGELRGDLEWKDGITLRTEINTAQEVPMPVLPSTAFGNGYVHFNNAMDTLEYMIYSQGLTSPAIAAHFHKGATGMAGAPVVNITNDINGNWIIGSMTGANINSALVQDFLKGQIYLNIHTAGNAAGEIRGQLSPNTRIALATQLEGEQEVPGVRTMAYGSGSVSVSNSLEDVSYAILADNLTGEVSAAHFHNAEAGVSGGVLLALTDDIDQGNDNGVWIEGSNTADFTTEIGGFFANDKVYVNLHTAANPGGELRGQVELYARLFLDNGILPFNPMFTGKLSLHSQLSSANETHAVNGDANGTLGVVLSKNMDSLYFNTTVNNLSGPISGAHFHKGMVGEDGPVDVNLTTMIRGNVIAGTVTDFDLAALLSGQYYINVHTMENPAGETRGQVMLNSDMAFTTRLTTENETHTVVSDAEGMAIVRVYPDMKHIEIKVLFDKASSKVTGAHLHNAPAGMDGGVVLNLSEDIDGNMIATTKMNADIIADLIAGNIYVNVHTEDNPSGEIRGQLALQSGVFFDTWLNGAQENPPTNTSAKGLAAVKLDAETGKLNYDVFTSGVATTISGTHIHEGEIGVNGNVAINLSTGILNNIISGNIDLSAELKANFALLLSGNGYLNVHSGTFPMGEIRGQLRTYNREAFAFNLTSDQEVPALSNNTTGTGVVSINNEWDMLTVDVTYANFDGKITGAHIHQGKEGENGPVIVSLTGFIDEDNQTIRANINAEGGLNSEVIEAIMSGNAYLNVHSEKNGGGETRGQINNSAKFSSPTSVEYIELPQVNLYPNPAIHNVSLNITQYIKSPNIEIRVYDNSGRMSTNTTTPNTGIVNLDVNNLNPGVYFIEVLGDDTNIRAKFIKQ